MMDSKMPGRVGAWTMFIAAAAFFALSGQASAQTGDGAAVQPILKRQSVITGARVNPRPHPVYGAAAQPAMPVGFYNFLFPATLAARNHLLYVLDSGRNQIYRYDLDRQDLTLFANYAANALRGMAIASDMSVYVADAITRQVVHYTLDGKQLRTFSSSHELARPVAVVLDERTGQLLVADGLYNHVVVFNSLGTPMAVLKSEETRGIDAMASGPDGLYLLDRAGQMVAVIGRDGTDRYTLGENVLKDPGAIVVDRFNRVFVSDNFDHTIKIFEQGNMVATFGGTGPVPGSFNRITGLWLERDVLYVADGPNARIQTFHVASPKGREILNE